MKLLAAFLLGIAVYHAILVCVQKFTFRQSGAREGEPSWLEREPDFV